MPIYEYQCKSCQKTFEKLIRTMSEEGSAACPECGSKRTARALSVFAVGADAGAKNSIGPTMSPQMCARRDATGCCPCSGE